MSINVLPFEQPILELGKRIRELEDFQASRGVDLSASIRELRSRQEQLAREIYANLTPWQRVQLARHLNRPTTLDLAADILEGFVELHGDRLFADDKALVCGFGKLDSQTVLLVGHQKGRDTAERLERNWALAHAEGYRKALHKMQLAARFNIPILTFIDTAGAYPGIGAEERGVAHAIALNLHEMSRLPVPIVCTVIGEGGSGGALGIGVGDRLLMLQNTYYSVITPEGCAAILWKTAEKKEDAARALKLTPQELLELGIVDQVVPEPVCGAHNDRENTSKILKQYLIQNLNELLHIPVDILLERRYEKYRRIGFFEESIESADL